MLILSVFAHILDYILDYIIETIQIAQCIQNRFDMLEYLDVIGFVGNAEYLPKAPNLWENPNKVLLQIRYFLLDTFGISSIFWTSWPNLNKLVWRYAGTIKFECKHKYS